MKTFEHKNYWALILGGSSGIGLATLLKLAAEGMHIAVVHRSRRATARSAEVAFEQAREQGVQVKSFNLDGTKIENIAEVVEDLQAELPEGHKIRLLLHAIAKGNLKPLVASDQQANLDSIENNELKEAYSYLDEQRNQLKKSTLELSGRDFQLTIYNMAVSLVDWVQAVFQAGLFAGDARVLGLTSEGNQKAWANYAAVSAAKLSLEGIVRAIALEYAAYGIRANVLQPGITDTESLRMIPGNDQLRANALFRNPLGRMTTPEDVANAVYLLCRDEAAWINGALIPVDGGERVV